MYVTISEDSNRIAVEVGDTGKGIPLPDQGKIFMKFEQAKGERHGTGLGLYIVKSFLAGHNSDIRLESDPGKGTRFFFSLPPGGTNEAVNEPAKKLNRTPSASQEHE